VSSPGSIKSPVATPKIGPSGILSVSLKNPTGLSEKEISESRPLEEANLQTTEFSREELIRAWLAYAEEFLQADPLLMSTMKSSLPDLTDHFRFQVKVYNPEQVQRLQEKATDILVFIRKQLQNSEIRMEVGIHEETNTRIVLDDTKKLELMIEENKSLIDLIEEFDLRLD
jgi:hypothetical protein